MHLNGALYSIFQYSGPSMTRIPEVVLNCFYDQVISRHTDVTPRNFDLDVNMSFSEEYCVPPAAGAACRFKPHHHSGTAETTQTAQT